MALIKGSRNVMSCNLQTHYVMAISRPKRLLHLSSSVWTPPSTGINRSGHLHRLWGLMGDLVGCPMVVDEVEGGYIMMGYRMLPETCFKTLECFFSFDRCSCNFASSRVFMLNMFNQNHCTSTAGIDLMQRRLHIINSKNSWILWHGHHIICQPPAIPPAFPGLCGSTATSTTSVPTPATPPAPVADMHWQPYHAIAPAPEEETPLPAAWPQAPPKAAAAAATAATAATTATTANSKPSTAAPEGPGGNRARDLLDMGWLWCLCLCFLLGGVFRRSKSASHRHYHLQLVPSKQKHNTVKQSIKPHSTRHAGKAGGFDMFETSILYLCLHVPRLLNKPRLLAIVVWFSLGWMAFWILPLLWPAFKVSTGPETGWVWYRTDEISIKSPWF